MVEGDCWTGIFLFYTSWLLFCAALCHQMVYCSYHLSCNLPSHHFLKFKTPAIVVSLINSLIGGYVMPIIVASHGISLRRLVAPLCIISVRWSKRFTVDSVGLLTRQQLLELPLIEYMDAGICKYWAIEHVLIAAAMAVVGLHGPVLWLLLCHSSDCYRVNHFVVL